MTNKVKHTALTFVLGLCCGAVLFHGVLVARTPATIEWAGGDAEGPTTGQGEGDVAGAPTPAVAHSRWTEDRAASGITTEDFVRGLTGEDTEVQRGRDDWIEQLEEESAQQISTSGLRRGHQRGHLSGNQSRQRSGYQSRQQSGHPSGQHIDMEASNHKPSVSGPRTGAMDRECSSPVTNIYFVKIHKTGSTTFQNILNRFGLRRGLRFALFHCPYAMPYPHPAYSKYLTAKPHSGTQRPPQYNIMKDHARYVRSAWSAYMPRDTRVISLVRQPFSQLKSAFSFFKLAAAFNLSWARDPVAEFLQQPGEYDAGRDSYSCAPVVTMSHTQNTQAHHLGWQNYTTSEGMEQWLETLDKELDMVLILEHFEESLLLLRRRFCWTYKDIISMKLMSSKSLGRKSYSTKATPELLSLHKQWSPVDYLLYDHFLSKLRKQIAMAGEDLQNEVHNFNEINKNVSLFCKNSCEVFDKIKPVNMTAAEARLILAKSITLRTSPWQPELYVSKQDCLEMIVQFFYQKAIVLTQYHAKHIDKSDMIGALHYPSLKKSKLFSTRKCRFLTR